MDEQKIEQSIIKLATERGGNKTICPSEVAKILFPNDWRDKMQVVRKIAFNLAAAGKVYVLQKGIEIDPNHYKGPIRIRIKY